MRGALLMAVMLAATAVGADEMAQARLAENRAKWEALRIRSYSFVIWINGAWTPTTPIQIVVWNGNVKSARYMHPDAPADATWESRESWALREGPDAQPTWSLAIPALFDRAKEPAGEPRNGDLTQNFALWVNNFKVPE